MKIVYIASSIIPSRTANSIHVMKMCQAFARNSHDVTLIVPDIRTGNEPGVENVFEYYGVEECFVIVKERFLPIKGRGHLFGLFAALRARRLAPDIVYGRDISGCAFASFARITTIIEVHESIAKSTIPSKLLFYAMIMTSALKRIVVITDALKWHYRNRYSVITNRLFTAPDGADPIPESTVPARLQGTGELKIGYVGHLYQGRGLEVIEFLAKTCPWADFHVVGGRPDEIEATKKQMSNLANVYLHGFVPPARVDAFKLACDVLVAPYQADLRTNAGRNTVRWMSPLKVFEYMAAGKPIVCSDLPVLREILVNNSNAILVPPAEHDKWVMALERLRDMPSFGVRLGTSANEAFLSKYTWSVRAQAVVL